MVGPVGVKSCEKMLTGSQKQSVTVRMRVGNIIVQQVIGNTL